MIIDILSSENVALVFGVLTSETRRTHYGVKYQRQTHFKAYIKRIKASGTSSSIVKYDKS